MRVVIDVLTPLSCLRHFWTLTVAEELATPISAVGVLASADETKSADEPRMIADKTIFFIFSSMFIFQNLLLVLCRPWVSRCAVIRRKTGGKS